MERPPIPAGLRRALRGGLRRLVGPLVGLRLGELTVESRELRVELAEARQRIDALNELVQRLDGLVRESD